MIHAAVVLAGSGVALTRRGAVKLLALALGLMTVGCVLFSGEIALAGLKGWRPLPLAAPTGGLCLIAGWFVLAGFGARECLMTPASRTSGRDDV